MFRSQTYFTVSIILILVLSSLWVRTQVQREEISQWTNILEQHPIAEREGAVRFWLEGPSPLCVTIEKYAGGNRNRHWELRIEKPTGQRLPSGTIRSQSVGSGPNFSGGLLLVKKRFMTATNRILEPIPGLWYRRQGRDWLFLVKQDMDAVSTGPTEIVPRSQIQIGKDCPYGEGFFRWKTGTDSWIPSDSNGDPLRSEW